MVRISSRALERLSVESSIGLLVDRLRLLQRERDLGELRGDGRAVELGDHVALLHHRPLGHEGRDLHLIDFGLLRVRRDGDLDELEGPKLAGGGHRDLELALLHASDQCGVFGLGVPGHEPRARGGDEKEGGAEDEAAIAED